MNFKIGDRVFVRGYIDEIRKDMVIVRNDGGYFGTIPSEVITGELPSAQPTIEKRKRGHWITKSTNGEMFDCCSVCGYVEWDEPKSYCPNCGSDMRGGRE